MGRLGSDWWFEIPIRPVVDRVMQCTVPQVAGADADEQPAADLETEQQPGGRQDHAAEGQHADPRGRTDEGERRRVVLAMHRG